MYSYFNVHSFTDNKTRWTQHDTNTKLDGRISDITQWKETLSRTLTDTEKNIEKVCSYTPAHCYKCTHKYILTLTDPPPTAYRAQGAL